MGLRTVRYWLAGVIVSLVVASALSVAFWFNLFSGWQEAGSDFFFKARGLNVSAREQRVAIVAVDDRSLEELGRFGNWPRSLYTRLLDYLRQAQARVVAFDILFSEPSPDDALLQEAMRRAGNVVQPVVGTPNSPNRTRRGDPVEFERFLKPLPGFIGASVALGHANFLPGEDGSVRVAPLVVRSQGEDMPSLALAAAAVYLRRPAALEISSREGILPFAGRSIPVDGWQRMAINYLGPPSEPGKPSTLLAVPFVDVLRGKAAADLFFDKLVLVGVMATGEPDSYITPVSPAGVKMFGVEIHGNAVETILRADFLTRQDTRSAIGSIFFLALIAGFLVQQLRPLWAAPAVVALGLLYLLAAFIMFDRGLMLNMVYPPMGLAATFVAASMQRVMAEEARRREVLSLFGRFVSPEVQREILSQAGAGLLKLGGVRRQVTVLFADLRGFTGISERLEPEEVVELLNGYLSAIISIILKHQGIVNKFAGDSLMAVWNAPVYRPDHALRAVSAAVEIQQAIRSMSGKNAQALDIGFGVGVNTGEAVAGNVGSQDRLEYTMIGDTVNLAARLTGAAASGQIWIGPETYRAVKETIVAETLPGQRFKGKTGEITVYRVKCPWEYSPSLRGVVPRPGAPEGSEP